jgi:hypothetical protein
VQYPAGKGEKGGEEESEGDSEGERERERERESVCVGIRWEKVSEKRRNMRASPPRNSSRNLTCWEGDGASKGEKKWEGMA